MIVRDFQDKHSPYQLTKHVARFLYDFMLRATLIVLQLIALRNVFYSRKYINFIELNSLKYTYDVCLKNHTFLREL